MLFENLSKSVEGSRDPGGGLQNRTRGKPVIALGSCHLTKVNGESRQGSTGDSRTKKSGTAL